MKGTVDSAEIARFEAEAARWWDPHGPFRPLHKFNPARLAVLRDWIAEHFGREPTASRPLEGLSLVDIGCGGGLVAEPMARLGADVLGIDAGKENVMAALAHRPAGLRLDYRTGTAEALDRRFDVVLALEIVEHVADLGLFLGAVAAAVNPGGLVVLASLNRTAKSFALAIIGAEYVLGWVPRGTHDWRKFVTPEELAAGLSGQGLEVGARTGLRYDPLFGRWSRSGDLGVNYMISAHRLKHHAPEPRE